MLKFYKDGVFQAVTFACLIIYWWVYRILYIEHVSRLTICFQQSPFLLGCWCWRDLRPLPDITNELLADQLHPSTYRSNCHCSNANRQDRSRLTMATSSWILRYVKIRYRLLNTIMNPGKTVNKQSVTANFIFQSSWFWRNMQTETLSKSEITWMKR